MDSKVCLFKDVPVISKGSVAKQCWVIRAFSEVFYELGIPAQYLNFG